MSDEGPNNDELLALVPSAREARARVEQDLLLEDRREKREAAKKQLTQVRELINLAKKFPINYHGSLNEVAIEMLEVSGWQVTNAFVPHEHDGPGTQPTWKIEPRSEAEPPAEETNIDI